MVEIASQLPYDVSQMLTVVVEAYAPLDCFVVDVAEVIDKDKRELGVIEYNAFNSSGVYGCDVAQLVQAVTQLVDES